MEALEWHHGDFTISTDRDRFDVEVFHDYLAEGSYWAQGRLLETTEAAIANSLIFGAYAAGGSMVGAARVVTDCATFGWLCDLFVLEGFRGNGLGEALVSAVREHPCLADTKRILLATADAHSLYEKHGFHSLGAPERWMEYNGGTV
jgi:GNAT superfamily N-acetyltransferase